MIDNLEWVDGVLSGGCHALIKGTNERHWITPHRAGFHDWTWEIFVGQRYTARAFWHGQKLWMAPRQSPSTTTPPRHRGKQRKSRQAQRGMSAVAADAVERVRVARARAAQFEANVLPIIRDI